MKISVVVPTYNRAEMIRLTLEAILSQTHAALEVIVVDDGSTDDTSRTLEEYGSRVRVVRILNSGELVARNTGLRLATGDLVAFCDSDDVWRPERLSEVNALWARHPEIKFAYGNFVTLRNDTWDCADKFSAAPPEFWSGLHRIADFGVFRHSIVERLVTFQPFFPSTLVVRRQFFLDIGGWDEAVTGLVGCDLATALRLTEHAPSGVMWTPLIGIRKHNGNFSADLLKMNLGDSRVLEHVLATRPSLARHTSAILASIDRRRKDALHIAFGRVDFVAVRQIFATIRPQARRKMESIKYYIARLPSPVAHVVATTLIEGRNRLSETMRRS